VGGGKITFEALDYIFVQGTVNSIGASGGTLDSCIRTHGAGGAGGGGGGQIVLRAYNISIPGGLVAAGGQKGTGSVGTVTTGKSGGNGGGGYIGLFSSVLDVSGTLNVFCEWYDEDLMDFVGPCTVTYYNGTVDWIITSLKEPTNNSNATTCNNLGCNITVSADTNTVVDIVLNGTVMTRSGGGTIPASAYTWNTTNGTSLPNPIIELNATVYEYRAGYKVGDSVAASGKRSWQAQLDIPSAQTAGIYNNTLSFCANQEDTKDCG
jgi:hypothetical protein